MVNNPINLIIMVICALLWVFLSLIFILRMRKADNQNNEKQVNRELLYWGIVSLILSIVTLLARLELLAPSTP